MARALAMPGRNLTLLARNRDRLEDVAVSCRAKGATCRVECVDQSDTDRLSSLLDETARAAPIDLLVANAGILGGRPADDAVESGATARRVLETNLL